MEAVLIVGYGNELRCDDAAGVVAAEALQDIHLEGVEIITRQQLVPEMAEAISRARGVIFLDAVDADADATVERKLVEPSSDRDVLTHACDPQTLLALAQALSGRCPEAWCVTIPGEDFEIGRRLSARTRAGIDAALREVKRLCEKFHAG
jgi:hydrogenase maturation protease